MKRILSTLTLIGLASQLQAMTPSELIQQMQTQLDGHHHRISTESPRAHHPHRTQTQAPKAARQISPRRHSKSSVIHRKKIERALAGRTAIRRNFRTLDEFRSLHRHAANRPARRSLARPVTHRQGRMLGKPSARANRYLGNGWYEDEHGQYDEQYTQPVRHQQQWHRHRHHRGQHAYRHYRRQWYLTYLYERATFVDRHGYRYGYFNQRGFIFEGQFYHYDRAYTYQDRLHGKDLFAHRFYRPIHRYAFDRWDGDRELGGGFYFSWSI